MSIHRIIKAVAPKKGDVGFLFIFFGILSLAELALYLSAAFAGLGAITGVGLVGLIAFLIWRDSRQKTELPPISQPFPNGEEADESQKQKNHHE